MGSRVGSGETVKVMLGDTEVSEACCSDDVGKLSIVDLHGSSSCI